MSLARRMPRRAALPGRLMLQLDRDGFAPEEPITIDQDLDTLSFTLENRTEDAHTTTLDLALPADAAYALFQDGAPVPLQPAKNWDFPLRAQLTFPAERPLRITLIRTSRERAVVNQAPPAP